MVARPLRAGGPPGVATLDDTLWERVGRLLVARGRVTRRELDAALAEQRRRREPLDEILIERGHVTRHEIASLVLVVQLGKRWRERFRERSRSRPGSEPLPDVPVGGRRFALTCLGVDVAVLTAAVLMAAIDRGRSNAPLPPAGWTALFAGLTLLLYWSWRPAIFRTRFRPWADALLVAGATSLAAMVVFTIRSLAGESGSGAELLPLWAFVTVYGVAGRLGFYLARTARPAVSPVPEDSARRRIEETEPSEAQLSVRRMEVVPLRPELWSVLDELRREVDVIAREQREAQIGDEGFDIAEAG